MLEATYIHCPGVGPATERRIWAAGAHTWRDYAAARSRLRVGPAIRERLDETVEASLHRLDEGDWEWFARSLPQREHWRAFPAFRRRAVYLDIETNGGLGPNDITLVGMYDGSSVRQFVRGIDLHEFPDAIGDAAVIVTFFGTGFDLPFLRRAYGIGLPQLHVDLCFLLRRLGHRGGLKQIEQAFGINRSDDTHGLGGWDAVLLWQQWRRGNRRALERLLTYNREDIVNLERLMEMALPIIEQRTRGGYEPLGSAADVG